LRPELMDGNDLELDVLAFLQHACALALQL
jgi:hypothetical protein